MIGSSFISSFISNPCGDSLDRIFCQQCICKFCGKGAHYCYNCPPKVPIISNPEQCNQTINELPQILPNVHPTCNYGYNCPLKVPIISNPEQCNQTINELPQTLRSVHPTCNYEDENSFTYDSKPNSFNDSPSVLTHPPQL
ncbi:hypothetical protein Tco_0107814 [Tanacetum coccineum]